MKKEIRKYIAEKLISWAFSIMPDYEFKTKLAKFINENLK